MRTLASQDRDALRRLAHAMLRKETGASAISRLCGRCGSAEHGRPLALMASDADGPAPAVSISYAGGLVSVAWSWSGPVGIDIEETGPPVDGVDRREWTRREAVFKAGPGDHAVASVEVPHGYLGTVAGSAVSWRLAGPAAPAG